MNRKIIIVFILFFNVIFSQDNNISYSIEIGNELIRLNTPFKTSNWIKDSKVEAADVYYNNDKNIRLTLNTSQIEKHLPNNKDLFNYLKKTLESNGYDQSKIYFTYISENSSYKCFYNDDKESFIIYCYRYKTQLITAGFYCYKYNEDCSLLTTDFQLFLDQSFSKVELELKENIIEKRN